MHVLECVYVHANVCVCVSVRVCILLNMDVGIHSAGWSVTRYLTMRKMAMDINTHMCTWQTQKHAHTYTHTHTHDNNTHNISPKDTSTCVHKHIRSTHTCLRGCRGVHA